VTVSRPYRGVSAEQRRTERRARLIEAALDVVGEDGVAAVNMKSVRIRAELSERYFYESFRDRDELLVALLDTLSHQLREAFTERLAVTPPDLFARSYAGAVAIIDVITGDPRKARLFVEAARGGAFTVQRTPYYQAHAEVVASQLRELGGVADGPRVQTTALLLVSGLAQTLGVWLDGGIDLTRDQLAEHFARLVVASATTG